MPNWLPLQRAMAHYCEAFFQALNRWRSYEDPSLIENRLNIVTQLCYLLKEWIKKSNKFIFELKTEEPLDLLPACIPICGLGEFEKNQDMTAFNSAKQFVPKDLFQSGGWFFQNTILQGLAGK